LLEVLGGRRSVMQRGVALAVAAVTLVAWTAACGGGHADQGAAPGRAAAAPPAPPLAGTDPATGAEVGLADFAGTPVVVNFWASWCGPCREELPALEQLAAEHPELQVLGVNYMDEATAARALQRELGFTFPSVSDPKGRIGGAYGLLGMPTTFFLDAEHRVRAKAQGPFDEEEFDRGIALVTTAP
jgi:cytochrome c biogenesis protein CcmG/thiol:disulfide interchange protein DsbE